jgi:ubiquinone/menaquinone biosynthesis C-methylase UbiE
MTAGFVLDNPAYFDRLAEVERSHWWSWGMWRLADRWLSAALKNRQGLRALDVGCGSGQTAVRLSLRPEIETVIGLDSSPVALRYAKRVDEHSLVQGTVLALPFDDAAFDVIICFDVLQHLTRGSEIRAASELHRALKAGGLALIRSNGRGGLVTKGEGPPYRIEELNAICTSAGFEVVRSTYANCLPALVQEFRGRWFRERSERPHPSGGGLRIKVPSPGINRLMAGVSAGEAMLAGSLAFRLPFGHSTFVLACKTDRPIGLRSPAQ